MRFLINKWRFYTLERKVYIDCLDRDYASNLTSMIIGGFVLVSFTIFAIFNWSYYSTFVAWLFPVLTIASMMYTAICISKYRQHIRGKKVSKRFVLAMMLGAYIAGSMFSVFIDVILSPTAVSVIFITILIGGVLLLPAIAPLSLFLNLGILALYTTLTLVFVAPECCYVCDIAPAAFGTVVGICFAWYVNMHKMVAVNTKIELEQERDKFLAQSITDELTQLGNRRDFKNKLERYLTDNRKNDNFLCLAIMDIDHFKDYNDYYGHPKGDECLRDIGRALSYHWENPSVYAARIGGEEFALLWFEENEGGAKNVVLQAQERIKELDMPHERSSVSSRVTFSIGVHIHHMIHTSNTQDIYKSADNALYKAKDEGRNSVIFHHSSNTIDIEDKKRNHGKIHFEKDR